MVDKKAASNENSFDLKSKEKKMKLQTESHHLNTLQGITRRKFITGLAAAGICAGVIPSIQVPEAFAADDLMQIARNIIWTGQASVKISGLGANIFVDPFKIKNEDKADIVMITHSHDDHLSFSSLKKICTDQTTLIAPKEVAGKIKRIPQKQTLTVQPGDTVSVGDVTIQAVAMYNIRKTKYHPKSKKWTGYVMTGNGISIYHAGDTERIPEMKDIKCDIALLPLGQKYTMNSVKDAAESAKDVGAKLAVPIHYGMYEGTKGDAEKFKTLLAGAVDVFIIDRV